MWKTSPASGIFLSNMVHALPSFTKIILPRRERVNSVYGVVAAPGRYTASYQP